MAEKLGIAGVFTFFLLVATGVAISSHDVATQTTYAGKPGFDAAVNHIFYGLNFAVMVVGISVLGLLVAALILALAIGWVFIYLLYTFFRNSNF